jgi:hypothetical protein
VTTVSQREAVLPPHDLKEESKSKPPVNDDLDRFNRTRQPIYRSGKLKRTASDADTKYLDKGRPSSIHETSNTPLLSSHLTENREITRSLGRLNDQADGEFVSNLNTQRIDGKPRSSHSIPETITEVSESPTTDEGLSFSTDPRIKRESNKKTSDGTRRHTLMGSGNEVQRIPAHTLHEGFSAQKKKKEIILPPEVIEQYSDYSREELVNMLHQQRQQMTRRDAYVKDMESYIDNLLVRVMESTPKILQNPYGRNNPYGHMSIASSSSNIPLNGHHSNYTPANHPDFTPTSTPTKKPVSNPFKRLQTRK